MLESMPGTTKLAPRVDNATPCLNHMYLLWWRQQLQQLLHLLLECPNLLLLRRYLLLQRRVLLLLLRHLLLLLHHLLLQLSYLLLLHCKLLCVLLLLLDQLQSGASDSRVTCAGFKESVKQVHPSVRRLTGGCLSCGVVGSQAEAEAGQDAQAGSQQRNHTCNRKSDTGGLCLTRTSRQDTLFCCCLMAHTNMTADDAFIKARHTGESKHAFIRARNAVDTPSACHVAKNHTPGCKHANKGYHHGPRAP